jgi:YVTN family beta-propeller protein
MLELKLQAFLPGRPDDRIENALGENKNAQELNKVGRLPTDPATRYIKRLISITLLCIPTLLSVSCGDTREQRVDSGSGDTAATTVETQFTPAGAADYNGGPNGPVQEPESVPQSQSGTLPVAVAVESLPAFAAGAPPLAGDGNADGCVTGADYTIWADNFGTLEPAGSGDGDYSGDGVVDGADYTLWADNFSVDCVADVPAANAVEVLVTPSSATLTQIGETVLLSAQVFDAAGQEIDAEFTWQSSRPNQLEVDQTGQVMALGVGSAEIWAEASGVESPPSMLDMILADPNAYVTNTAAGVVTVIDTLTDTVLATIPVGASPTRVAVTRDGARVYVANTGGNSVSVIDTSTNAVVATVPLPSAPTEVAIQPNGAEVYVLDTGGSLQVISTSLIGTASDPVVATISFGTPGFNQYGASIAIVQDGTLAYVVVSGALHLIDTTTYEVLGSLAVGASPSQVVISPDGARAYVTSALGTNSLFGGQVVVVNTATNSILNTISLPGVLPNSLAITPDGARAYVAITEVFADAGIAMGFVPDNHVAVLDLASGVLNGWITVPGVPAGGVAITPDGLRVYVAMPGGDAISVIDTETDALVTAIGVDAVPTGIAVSAAQALDE